MIYTALSPKEIRIGELNCVRIDGIEHFSVLKTFDCGQCFRFDRVTDTKHECEFAGVAYGRYVSFAQDGSTLYIYNSNLKDYGDIWKEYLALDRDYDEINSSILSLSNNPALMSAVEKSDGIRILKQEPWEAICSFIVSQNNNIPRIKKIIAALSQKCGCPTDTSLMDGHIADTHRGSVGHISSFPTPDSLYTLGVDGLFELKTGFRAKYIFDAAEKVREGEIDFELLLGSDSLEECIAHLSSIRGIGPKVASCALLFGFSRLDAFPVDVWIKKVIAKYFDDDFSPAALGKYAGVAQQYLFYYERYLNS